ncbi:hypothetical protein [Zoogloea sp.]|uniref:hypothetical protein n=1 Tax=Zoogloea sp. TaxID=49181 RepID=UPI0035AE3152
MKTVFLPSSSWLEFKLQCDSLLGKIVDEKSSEGFFILDHLTVKREVLTGARLADERVVELDFKDWVGDAVVEEGLINIELIRRSVSGLRSGLVVVIDASGFDVSVVLRGLRQFGMALYSLEDWPACVVLVADSAHRLVLGPALTHAFYIQPDVINRTDLVRISRRVMFESRLMRFFGKSATSSFKWVSRLFNWVEAKKAHRYEKKLGPFWEE